jgi:hypothetical protein
LNYGALRNRLLQRRQQQINAGMRPEMSMDDMPPAPFIEPEFGWIWRAWHRLHPDRPQWAGGMGPTVPGAIPWTVVRLWADYHRLSRGEFDMLDRVIQAMDAEYMAWWSERQQNDAAQPARRRA